MGQIVTKSYFQNSNWLYIPLSVPVIVANTSIQTPNNASYIDNLCIEVERAILLNSLGISLYNELQLAIADDFTQPQYADLEKLVKGEEYDGKVWRGLDYDYSLIACKIFEEFNRNTDSRLAGAGNVQVMTEGANASSPNKKIVKANQMFITQYQGENSRRPKLSNNVLTWLGTEQNEVSMFRYLSDRQEQLGWSASNFVFDGMINDMGL